MMGDGVFFKIKKTLITIITFEFYRNTIKFKHFRYLRDYGQDLYYITKKVKS